MAVTERQAIEALASRFGWVMRVESAGNPLSPRGTVRVSFRKGSSVAVAVFSDDRVFGDDRDGSYWGFTGVDTATLVFASDTGGDSMPSLFLFAEFLGADEDDRDNLETELF